jgi:predicted flap endonuclease-1-like 5' DNA nuclease
VRIDVIEGIGVAHASALSRAGVTHVRHLLQRGATPGGREALARETGLSPAQLVEWVNHIDLMRIRGVGAEYSDLLEAAGVDSPVELAQRSPARLAILLAETNAERPLVRRVPSEKVLAGWISEARTLPPLITH